MHTEERPLEHMVRRYPSVIQGKNAYHKPNSLTLSHHLFIPWTSSLQTYKKINFCCLSNMVCGVVSLQPEKTSAEILRIKDRKLSQVCLEVNDRVG